MELLDNYFRFRGCMLHARPNKLCEKAKVGGEKKQQDEGFSQKQADGRMP